MYDSVCHRLCFAVLVLGGLFLLPGCGGRGDAAYPSRPVTYVVPWNAGGGTDTVSRALAAVLGDALGASVNVVNRTSGGGVVGHLAIAQAAAEGHTLGAVTAEAAIRTPVWRADLYAYGLPPSR